MLRYLKWQLLLLKWWFLASEDIPVEMSVGLQNHRISWAGRGSWGLLSSILYSTQGNINIKPCIWVLSKCLLNTCLSNLYCILFTRNDVPNLQWHSFGSVFWCAAVHGTLLQSQFLVTIIYVILFLSKINKRLKINSVIWFSINYLSKLEGNACMFSMFTSALAYSHTVYCASLEDLSGSARADWVSFWKRNWLHGASVVRKRVRCESDASVSFANPKHSMLWMVIIVLPEVPGVWGQERFPGSLHRE